MLKVGGDNVSAAEVESYLLRHPGGGHRASGPRARRLLRRGAGRLRPAQAGRDGDRRGDHRFLLGQDCDLPGATPRPVRHRVAHVRHQDQAGTKIKKAILREMIAAELKEKGITRAPKISAVPLG